MIAIGPAAVGRNAGATAEISIRIRTNATPEAIHTIATAARVCPGLVCVSRA